MRAEDFATLPRPAVVCTIVRVAGSAPREVGAKMWVTGQEFYGTLGGGKFELSVLCDARAMLTSSAGPSVKEYVLCREMGQCCGGRVEVFFELAGRRRTAHLFGAGHVGRAAAQVLSGMPFSVVLIDPRPEWAGRGGLPEDVAVIQEGPVEYARSRTFTEDDAVCIFTHSHDLDYLLVEHFLKVPVGYLGLIGSEHKARIFKARLARHPAADLPALEEQWEDKVRCPIGIPLPGKHPRVIAVSIAAELLKEWAARREGAARATLDAAG